MDMTGYFDMEYLCTMIGDLSGMPIRLYENGRLIFTHSFVKLPKDPVSLYIDDILKITDHIAYFSTEQFHYYGIICSGSFTMVTGPTMPVANTRQELRTLAFRLNIGAGDIEDFITGMYNISMMPLESVMQMLCTINYVLNNEKKTLGDVMPIISEPPHTEMPSDREAEELLSHQETAAGPHNTYDVERTVMKMVRDGDLPALESWAKNAPAVRGGVLSDNYLRQIKNTFIVTATLSSRAAIGGGLSYNKAFSLSDAYIQKCDLMDQPEQIFALQYQMIREFASLVERLRKGGSPSELELKVSNYIREHISEPITTEDIARDLGMSRSWLSRSFKKESGQSLADFILREKASEACRLLEGTDSSLVSISLYLGFSSQSHFSRTFKKYTGTSPGAYRKSARSPG